MNQTRLTGLALIGLAAFLVFQAAKAPAPPAGPQPAPCPGPGPCPVPQPPLQPGPCPPNRPCPRDPQDWLAGPDAGVGASVGGGKHADGTEIHCDLPGPLHMKNCGGSDGAGLCVFTSISHSARFQNVPLLKDFRDWMRNKPGGGYPSKVDSMVKRCAQEKSQAVPAYLQVESNDLEVLKAACRSGRMPGVTYSFSPTGRYRGDRISHMVSLVHADDRHFVILDNNYPGPTNYEWLSPDEFRRTYSGGSQGWAFVLLNPGPPPPPKN